MRPIMITTFVFIAILFYLVQAGKIPQFTLTIFGIYGGVATFFEEDYRKRTKKR